MMSRVIAPPPPPPRTALPFKPYEEFTTRPSIFCRIFTDDYNEFEGLSLSHGKAQGIYRNVTEFELKSRYQLFGVPCGYVYFVHN